MKNMRKLKDKEKTILNQKVIKLKLIMKTLLMWKKMKMTMKIIN